jgi:isopentenyl diphosphate isomerase/L-lactate dehydrogenase-like FMN-dependent dehydrogenase
MSAADCHDIADLRRAARRRLPRGLFDYVDRGCDTDSGLARNRAAFEAVTFAPAVLRGTSGRSTGITLFGRDLALPAAIAPMSPAGLLWHEGERGLAEAAAAIGIPYTLPTESMTPLDIIARTAAPLWFQLYVWTARQHSYALVDRAAAAGAAVLLLTVDTPVPPHRAFNERSGFTAPFCPGPRTIADIIAHPRWLAGTIGRYLVSGGLPRMRNHPGERPVLSASSADTRLDPSFDWDGLAELRRRWPGRLLVKGVLRADDARRAIEHGADGVVVSTHGARNLDAAIASLAALPAIAAAVKPHGAVLLDSGIRHGVDIARAIALGADAVLLGRAVLYGIAAYGPAGAARALALLHAEFDTALANLGCRSPAELGPHLLAP